MFKRLVCIAGLFCLWLTPMAPTLADDSAKALVDKVSPAIVMIHILVKMQFKGGGQSQNADRRMVSEGVIVDPDGLIMMSNASISSDFWRNMMGSDEEDDKSTFNISPTEFKVVVSPEQTEYRAFLAATDSKTGLAFLQLEDLGARKLMSVDLSTDVPVNVGDNVVAVTRMGKGNDYAPIYETAHVSGTITKPRPAVAVSPGIMGIGLPVFSAAGSPVGVMTLVTAGLKEADSDGMDVMMHFFTTGFSDRIGVFMLPLSTVGSVITEAKTQAAKLIAERAKSAAQHPAVETKPTPSPTTKSK